MMIGLLAAAAVVTTNAHMSVEGFLQFRAGDGAWIRGSGSVDVPTGPEGSVIRFEAAPGDDLMSRWVVIEPGHSYHVSPSACAGIAFRDLAKPARRPFVQVAAHELSNVAFPLRVLALDGSELDAITWPDIGHTFEAPIDKACADSGARVRVVDAKGKALVDEWIVVPNERVTRVILRPGGGFAANAFDAHYIYFREEVNRVDAVELRDLRIEGQPYGVRHTHGGAGASVSMAIFAVTNTGTKPRTLSATKAEMAREYGATALKLAGVGFGADESQYSSGAGPAPSVTIAPGEKKFVRVYVEPFEVYLASINSSHRWSVVFECEGKTATATVPLHVMRMEPLRREPE